MEQAVKLKFNSPYRSIKAINPINLPQMTILTGTNGSGKSHLLEAINSRQIIVEDIDNPHIVLFTYESFKLDDQDTIPPSQMSTERNDAWNFFRYGSNRIHIHQHLE